MNTLVVLVIISAYVIFCKEDKGIGKLSKKAYTMIAVMIAMFGILLSMNANSAEFTYQETNSGEKMAVIDGPIRDGDAETLKRWLDAGHKKFILNSNGGYVDVSWKMAELLRQAKATTVIPRNARCASACVNVFMGGYFRVAYIQGKLGVHPSHFGADAEKAQANLNETYDKGQTSAMGMAYRFAHYTDQGKEYETIKLLNKAFNTVTWKEMYYFAPKELQVIATHVYK